MKHNLYLKKIKLKCNKKKFNLPLTKNNFNTIPIMLICKDKCDFFMGSGIFRKPNTMIFECFKTSIFRVTKFLDSGECCVVLELLQPKIMKVKYLPHLLNAMFVPFFQIAASLDFIDGNMYHCRSKLFLWCRVSSLNQRSPWNTYTV